MMGREDDTTSEEGTSQVCSYKHTPKATLPQGFLLCLLAELDRDSSRGLGSAVCLSTQSISAHLPSIQMS